MNTRTLFKSFFYPSFIGVVLIAMGMPTETFAVTHRPTCSLGIVSAEATTTIHGEGNVFIHKGDAMQITWESEHAKKAVDGKGKSISLVDTITIVGKKSSTYSYEFSSGSKKATCTMNVKVITGSITARTLTSEASKPIISGKAFGTKTVQIGVYKQGSSKILYTSKIIRVKNGAWKTKITKTLADGEYDVVAHGDKNAAFNTLATGTLTVGKAARDTVSDDTKLATTFVVESVPLLLGGTARANASVAISYLQVINIGKEAASVNGFWVKQNGSAPIDAIVDVTVVDDLGEAHGSMTQAGGISFKDGSAFVPIRVMLPPSQMRLFTIKALIANNISLHVGKQLKIDVATVDADAKLQGTFPIRGTTWTIGY